ncbi:hsp90-like protein [Apiospora arundinis]
MDDLAAEDSPGSDHRYDDDEYRYTNEDCVALLCLYCRLPFQRGDWVVASSYVGPALNQPFRWYPYMRFYEEEFDSLLSPCMCDGEDNDNDHQLSSCHVTCHQFAAVNCPALHMTPELNRAVVHSADPPPSHDAQRFAWLRDSAAHCIHAQFSTLPLEICLEIAGYLVPEYAVLLQASYWQNASSCTCTVTTTSDIWARYISIDGTRYVAGLSNAPGEVYTAKIHIANSLPAFPMISLEDHLGVMELISVPMASYPSLVLAIQAALPAGVIGMRIHDGQQMEFEFDQAALVDLICSGRNVFYTGSAGCGKSTVLKAFTKRLRDMGKKVHVVAPTGRAALQVNGSTTWTYAGWTPDSHKKPLQELQNNAHGKFVWKRFKKTDVLVIDEISMVENLHFERLNKILQHALYNPNLSVQKAFGGIQIVVTGDFCQLPPVRPFEHCMECGKQLSKRYYQGELSYACPNPHHPVWRDEDKWAFASDAWQQCSFVHVNLKEIHRQKVGKFTEILNKCRIGLALTESDKQLLINHECQVTNATKLFATREEVARVNQQQFEKLISLEHTFWTRDTFRWQEKHPHLRWKGDRKEIGHKNRRPLQALDDHRFDQCVRLKQGMLVVLLVNLNLSQGLCNGSQGIVCGFERCDKDKLPKAVKRGKNDEVLPQDGSVIYGDYAHIKEAEIKSYIEYEGPAITFRVWPKVRFHNGQTRVIHAECSINELGDDAPYSLISRTQIPLAPAWAMTIHKSQSLTLDRVIVNLSRAFEVGQVYVALSRATGLEGLKIEGDIEGLEAGIGGNPKVQRFLRQHFGALNGPGFKSMKPLASGSSEPA